MVSRFLINRFAINPRSTTSTTKLEAYPVSGLETWWGHFQIPINKGNHKNRLLLKFKPKFTIFSLWQFIILFQHLGWPLCCESLSQQSHGSATAYAASHTWEEQIVKYIYKYKLNTNTNLTCQHKWKAGCLSSDPRQSLHTVWYDSSSSSQTITYQKPQKIPPITAFDVSRYNKSRSNLVGHLVKIGRRFIAAFCPPRKHYNLALPNSAQCMITTTVVKNQPEEEANACPTSVSVRSTSAHTLTIQFSLLRGKYVAYYWRQ